MMKTKDIVRNFVITVVIIIFIYSYKISFSNSNYLKMYQIYSPDYKNNYESLKNTYNLINDNYNFIPAEVINLNVKKISNLFIINKGFDDNVKSNSFVVSDLGLVGEVQKVYRNYSVVRLLSSKNTNISVEINECYGTLRVKNGNPYVDDLINCDNIKKNDSVFTSKYNYSSNNIFIGNIDRIHDNKIYIKYNYNPYKLRYVGVINDSN